MNTVTKLIPIDTRKHKELYDVFLATKLDDGATPTFLMRSTLHNLANIYWLRKEAIQRLLRETVADATTLPAVCFLYGLKGLEEHEYIFVSRATADLGTDLSNSLKVL